MPFEVRNLPPADRSVVLLPDGWEAKFTDERLQRQGWSMELRLDG